MNDTSNFLFPHLPTPFPSAAFPNPLQAIGLPRNCRGDGRIAQSFQESDARNDQGLRENSAASHAENMQITAIRLRLARSPG